MRPLALALLALALAAGASAADRHRIRTLTAADGPISAFAIDGGHIAWTVSRKRGCVWQVRVRTLATGRGRAIVAPRGATCRSATGFGYRGRQLFALAGRRALWTLNDFGNFRYTDVLTSSLAEPRDRVVESLVFVHDPYSRVTALDGEGATLVYGFASADVEEVGDCFERGTCRTVLVAGGVMRVVQGRPFPVPGTPPAADLAVSRGRVAVLVRGRLGEPPHPTAATVEVRDVVSGRWLGTVTASGAVRELAFDGRVVVLVGRRVEQYDLAGRLLATVAVPSGATDLAADRGRVIFRVGRAIHLLGRTEPLAQAAARPIGLSIQGKRVAWAENVRGRGRIRILTLPQ